MIERLKPTKAAPLVGAIVLMCAAASAPAAAQAAGEGRVPIVHKGKQKAIVIVDENPRRPAHVAAKELIHYVKKMTGVELPLYTDVDAPRRSWAPRRIYVGESAYTERIGLDNDALASQEYVIQTRGRNLILMGHDADEYGIVTYEKNGLWPLHRRQLEEPLFTEMGSLYAVHDFLRMFGVRWYLPGDIGEVCPGRDSIHARNLNVRRRPWTRYRWSSRLRHPDPFDFFQGQAGYDPRSVSRRDMLLHLVRMKVGGAPFASGHSYGSFYKRFADKHPDWWGKREPEKRGHLAYLHPGVIDRVVADARQYFETGRVADVDPRRVPAAGDFFAIAPQDSSTGWVRTSAARELIEPRAKVYDDVPASGFFAGYVSDYWFTAVNRVARKLKQSHPDKWVATLAYAKYTRPPDFEIEPNVAVQVAGNVVSSFYPPNQRYFEENLKLWNQRTRRLYTWEYYQRFQAFSDYKHFPVIFPRRVASGIRTMHKHGVEGMFFEDSGSPALLANPAEQMLNRYVTWRYLDDASLDIDKLLKRHYNQFYGPASKHMRAFVNGIERRWRSEARWQRAHRVGAQRRSWRIFCPPKVLRELAEPIEAAMAMQLDEPFRSRVRMMYEAVFVPMRANAQSYGARFDGRRRLVAPAISEAPAIDGKPDQAWRAAASTGRFVSRHGTEVELGTRAKVMRDDRHLYLLIEADEPRMERLSRVLAGHDPSASESRMKQQPSIDVMIDVNRRRRAYFRLRIMPDGRTMAQRIGEAGPGRASEWTARAKVSVQRLNDAYRVECAIPFKTLQADGSDLAHGRVWGLNVARRRGIGPAHARARVTCWAPAYGALDDPDTFGVLQWKSK